MATSIPQFNIKEVNEALIKIIQNPNVDFNDIYCAPDFATGGTITNAKAVKESLKYGKGESVRLKAKLEYFPDQNMIQATELPYGVFTNTVIDQLAALTNENESYGIERVVDHTKKVADIRIYLSKGANPKRMIAKLYKDTSLENWFSINMIMLDKGRFPKVFGWREACNAYITHIRECKRNEVQFDLDKALARKNIVEGLIKAYSIIDEVVTTIRASSNPSEASIALQTKFEFNEEQAKAILAMKLSSLTRLDIIKLNNELAELIRSIEWYRHLLNDSTALDEELIKILKEVADKFGDERRTKIIDIVEEDEEQKLVQEENVSIMLFDNNMIRVVKIEEIQAGKRGRKGTNIKPPKNANLINTLYSTNLGSIAAFTNFGRMYTFSINELEYDKDCSIYELIALQEGEQVLLLIDSTSFNSYKYLITVSQSGYIKRTDISEYNLRSKKGIIAVKIESNDKLVGVFLSYNEKDKIMVVNSTGNYNFYSISLISVTNRATKGIKAIKLNSNEKVASATIVKENINYKGILSISSRGYGKITTIDSFNETSRAIKGPQIMGLKENDSIQVVYAILEEQENLYIFSNNKSVLIKINTIPIQNRNTSGIKLIDATKSINIME